MKHLGFWFSVAGTVVGLAACSDPGTGLVSDPVSTAPGAAGTGMTTGTTGSTATTGTTGGGGVAPTATGASGGSTLPPVTTGNGGSSVTGAPMGGSAPVAGTSSGGSTMVPMGGMGAVGAATAGMGPDMGGSGPMAGTGSGGEAGGSGGSGGEGTSEGGSTSGPDDLDSGPNTMGWIGCSMGENTAAGYRRVGGTRMWGGYGNGGAVVQNWTSNTSSSWQRFDGQVQQNGEPVAVWIMICIFAQAGATAQEVDAMIENARSHSAPGVVIYITGQPLYEPGHVCTLAGADGPESTDRLAQEAADRHDDVIYPGQLRLANGEVSGDTCHANTQGEDALGEQAKAFWGQP